MKDCQFGVSPVNYSDSDSLLFPSIHTPEDKTLELLFTNSPLPVNPIKGMPPIGKADHDIVYIEYDIKAKRIQQAPRKIFLYKRADMDGLRDHLAQFKDSFLSSDHSHMSVNDMWVSFKLLSPKSSRLLKGLFLQK